MLNRMVTLATQSANGTYDNSTDRASLQKEVEQLSSEIDRIADSSNFNGINLLDGSLGQREIDLTGDTTNGIKNIEVSGGGSIAPVTNLDFKANMAADSTGTMTLDLGAGVTGIKWVAVGHPEVASSATTLTVTLGSTNGGSVTFKAVRDETAGALDDAAVAKDVEFYEGMTVTVTADAAKKQADGSYKYDSSVATADNVEKSEATGLKLQIGDTAASYNQLKVSITDMHVLNLGLAGISVATQDSASEAIDKIKTAINTVSGVRGTLGAAQNRLEHTQNNLSVMSENIQDAESTIRDTDVAEEMMSYTKNNILVQSAQAMLAQANSVPQGVLQLLQ
jgi:flagellin